MIISVSRQSLCALIILGLLSDCDRTESTHVAPPDQKRVTSSAPATALVPPVSRPTGNEPGTTSNTVSDVRSDAKAISGSAPTEDKISDSTTTLDLGSIVRPMFSRELFKLEPTRAQAYFAGIAALQAKPSDESSEQAFAGRSELPWLETVLLELHESEGRWSLSEAQITWRPPKPQARKLYDRLVTEVNAARGRKASFGRDESEGDKEQRFAGWTWNKGACEAIVALDSSGRFSVDEALRFDGDHPAVLLKVYTPEGP